MDNLYTKKAKQMPMSKINAIKDRSQAIHYLRKCIALLNKYEQAEYNVDITDEELDAMFVGYFCHCFGSSNKAKGMIGIMEDHWAYAYNNPRWPNDSCLMVPPATWDCE